MPGFIAPPPPRPPATRPVKTMQPPSGNFSVGPPTDEHGPRRLCGFLLYFWFNTQCPVILYFSQVSFIFRLLCSTFCTLMLFSISPVYFVISGSILSQPLVECIPTYFTFMFQVRFFIRYHLFFTFLFSLSLYLFLFYHSSGRHFSIYDFFSCHFETMMRCVRTFRHQILSFFHSLLQFHVFISYILLLTVSYIFVLWYPYLDF